MVNFSKDRSIDKVQEGSTEVEEDKNFNYEKIGEVTALK